MPARPPEIGRPVSQYAGFEGYAGWLAPSLMHRRRVMEHAITYVGLDVHKDTIAVAIAETGRRGEVREHEQDCEHTDGLEGIGEPVDAVGSDTAVLLRGWAMRLQDPAAANSGRTWMRRRRSFADPAQAR